MPLLFAALLLSGLDLTRGVKPVTENETTRFSALVIGVNTYKDPQFNLTYATPDAKLMASVLDYGEGVVLLTDEQATRANILDNVDAMLRKVKKGDLVVLYLAGHGVLLYNDFYFLPHEATEKTQFSAGIAATALIDALSSVIAKEASALVLFDACNAGAVGFDISRAYTEGSRGGIGLFFGAAPLEFAMETPSLKHGIFTYYLAEALKGTADKDKNGNVSLRELVDYVSARVKEHTTDIQNPVYIGTLAGKTPMQRKNAPTQSAPRTR